MSPNHIYIVLTNALCCSSKKALEVSKLFSTGNLCANNELIKLKLLNDKIKILSDYYFDTTDLETNNFNNKPSCLDEKKSNKLLADVMNYCDICECQLK